MSKERRPRLPVVAGKWWQGAGEGATKAQPCAGLQPGWGEGPPAPYTELDIEGCSKEQGARRELVWAGSLAGLRREGRAAERSGRS